MIPAVAATPGDEQVLVLGIGNLLWADEAFGVRTVQALHEQWQFPERVTLLDGGTQGYYLLPYVQAARRMIVFDAIDYGLPPGTLKILINEEVPRLFGGQKLSLHQTSFQEVLAIADLNGCLPRDVVLCGVQSVDIDNYGGALHPSVRACLQPAIEVALEHLRSWGCQPVARSPGSPVPDPLMPASLTVAADRDGFVQCALAR